MGTIDNKPYEIKGESTEEGAALEIIASSIKMPDGNTLADTIIIMNNRIKNLENTLEQIRKRL